MTGPRCTAHKKRSGDPCGSFPMANGKCRVHGGATPSGFAAPQTKAGRYSKHLPTRLAERYETARADPDLLALRDDIALIDSRLGEVVANLNTGESKAAWTLLSGAWAQFADRWKDMPPDDMERAVVQIGEVIRRGLSETYVWEEIRGLVKQRADLVANERMRLVQLQQMITSEQALTMLGVIVDTVRRHVRDRDALAAISADLGKLALLPAR